MVVSILLNHWTNSSSKTFLSFPFYPAKRRRYLCCCGHSDENFKRHFHRPNLEWFQSISSSQFSWSKNDLFAHKAFNMQLGLLETKYVIVFCSCNWFRSIINQHIYEGAKKIEIGFLWNLRKYEHLEEWQCVLEAGFFNRWRWRWWKFQ